MFVYVSEQREEERVGKTVPLTVESAGPHLRGLLFLLSRCLCSLPPPCGRSGERIASATGHCLHSQLMAGGWSVTLFGCVMQ